MQSRHNKARKPCKKSKYTINVAYWKAYAEPRKKNCLIPRNKGDTVYTYTGKTWSS